YRAGIFGKFWFWTVSYASQYGTSTGLALGLQYLAKMVPQLFFGAPVVWCFAAIGIFAVIKERGKSAALSFTISLLVWSFIGTSAGLYYREHYFILMLPAICLQTGQAMKWLREEIAQRMHIKNRVTSPSTMTVVGSVS